MVSKLWEVLCNLSIKHMGRQVSRLSWASFQELLGQMGFQGQKLNPELCGWLTYLMCLDLSSDLTMCRSRPTEALGSPVYKPSSSPASTKQSDESQALWHTEAADGNSCSRQEMWPCSVLAAIWRHRNQIQLACVKTPPPFCMVWSCKLHLFSKGKMY